MHVPNPAKAADKVNIQPAKARQEKKKGFKLARVAATVTAKQTKSIIRFTHIKNAVGIIGVKPNVPECNAGYSNSAKAKKKKLARKLTRPSAIAALLIRTP